VTAAPHNSASGHRASSWLRGMHNHRSTHPRNPHSQIDNSLRRKIKASQVRQQVAFQTNAGPRSNHGTARQHKFEISSAELQARQRMKTYFDEKHKQSYSSRYEAKLYEAEQQRRAKIQKAASLMQRQDKVSPKRMLLAHTKKLKHTSSNKTVNPHTAALPQTGKLQKTLRTTLVRDGEVAPVEVE